MTRAGAGNFGTYYIHCGIFLQEHRKLMVGAQTYSPSIREPFLSTADTRKDKYQGLFRLGALHPRRDKLTLVVQQTRHSSARDTFEAT